MSIETHYSLSQAAKQLGIARRTLRRWLAADLAMVMPQIPRGSKLMIPEHCLEEVLRKRCPKSDWSLLRRSAWAPQKGNDRR